MLLESSVPLTPGLHCGPRFVMVAARLAAAAVAWAVGAAGFVPGSGGPGSILRGMHLRGMTPESRPMRRSVRKRMQSGVDPGLGAAQCMALNEETERKWKTFGEWAEDQGIKSEQLRLAEFDGGLRGVGAQSSISSGDAVLSVPVASVLRVIGGNSRLPSKLQGYVSEQTWRDAEWWGQLALLLLWEKGMGRKASTEPTKFKAWIDMLPKSMNTPLHWTEAEIEELQYQPLVSKCIRQRTAWKVLYKQVQKDNPDIREDEFYLACEMARRCVRGFACMLVCTCVPVPVCTCVCACACAGNCCAHMRFRASCDTRGNVTTCSRAFSGPFVNRLPKDQIFLTGLLVAVSTQLNILDSASAVIGTVAVLLWIVGNALLVPRIFGLTHYVIAPMIDMVNHNGKPGAAAGVTYQALQASFEVLATKPYAAGDQVFISYGERSNDQLLQYYGFVESPNSQDVYEFANVPRALADACSKCSITAPGLNDFSKSYAGPALLFQTGFDPAFVAEMGKVCGGDAPARRVLCQMLRDELAKFPTSLEADEALAGLGKKGDDSPKALALQLRLEKKRLLTAQIASLAR